MKKTMESSKLMQGIWYLLQIYCHFAHLSKKINKLHQKNYARSIFQLILSKTSLSLFPYQLLVHFIICMKELISLFLLLALANSAISTLILNLKEFLLKSKSIALWVNYKFMDWFYRKKSPLKRSYFLLVKLQNSLQKVIYLVKSIFKYKSQKN